MPAFTYIARKSDGSRIQGSLDARDRRAAIARVEEEFGVPIQIDEGLIDKSPRSSHAVAREKTRSVPLAQTFLFTEQLAHLLSAGMTLDEALGILVQRLEQPGLKTLVRELHQALIDGRSLSQAMRDYPKIFSPLYVNMVAAGEASGALPHILRRLVIHLGEIKALRERVQQALLYPAFIAASGIALIIIFMTVMVPQLTKFLATTGQALPIATRLLINSNHIVTHYWWVAVLAAVGAYAIWKISTRAPTARRAWDCFVWNFPALGRIPRYRFYTQFARTLATLSENGVPLLKALELLEGITGNRWVGAQMEQARHRVTDGVALSAALRASTLFPLLFLDMLAVGEQTGRFAETVAIIADVHERELDKQVQFISTLVPLVIIIIVALLVGLMVYAILSAVFGLTSGLQGRFR